MKVVMVVVVVVMMVVVVESARQGHKQGSNNEDRKPFKIPKEFSQWDKLNKRFLNHIKTPPANLKENEIKPHLYTLLRTLDFLTLAEEYLDKNLVSVRSEEKARRIYTLLDLLSAQEPLRVRYLKQMREVLVALLQRQPNAAKPTVPSHFVLDAFDRHIKARNQRSQAVLRRVMVGSADNVNTLIYYKKGRYTALDNALKRYSISNPFMEVSEKQWYQIKPATSPHLTLSVDLLTWRLLLVNDTFSPTIFRFEPVPGKAQHKYTLQSAILSSSAQLSYPCHDRRLCFSYEDPASLQFIKLPQGEVAIVSKQAEEVPIFLQYAGPRVYKALPRVPEPSVTSAYQGEGSHWVLLPLKS